MSSSGEEKAIAQEIKTQLWILGGLVVVMWAVEILDQFVFRAGLRQTLDIYGIYPRNVVGLRGILFAPFLHGNFAHLIGNTVPFLVLGWLIMLRETSDFFWVSLVSAFVSGLGTWMFGSSAIHIGASGVVFGYLGYLLARGYFERSMTSIAMSLFVGTLYGSLLWGVLPTQMGISWEGHLFGFLGGVLAARLLTPKRKVSGV
ncbi:rhomboid family intramembrane serine protease [Phormidium sp. FACHB-592]|uniref:Rhomboid family intramembrane serine protease n=1 Tax=Stenomitos frigidus AS-A4 TaxID=2933935 RepID=A0ABV0KCZ2_9CYAN|nr:MULTISPECIES: rhomboid family intramembrane serine protease [Cyanophyceae]MBD2038081.1 rhomboid family intramembrane serine protease [Leptolyngbya sp. FACHB-321]MBD2077717.1 rhomboid family intramembrane serine protease [Phormidium sp. FACHB-592]